MPHWYQTSPPATEDPAPEAPAPEQPAPATRPRSRHTLALLIFGAVTVMFGGFGIWATVHASRNTRPLARDLAQSHPTQPARHHDRRHRRDQRYRLRRSAVDGLLRHAPYLGTKVNPDYQESQA